MKQKHIVSEPISLKHLIHKCIIIAQQSNYQTQCMLSQKIALCNSPQPQLVIQVKIVMKDTSLIFAASSTSQLVLGDRNLSNIAIKTEDRPVRPPERRDVKGLHCAGGRRTIYLPATPDR